MCIYDVFFPIRDFVTRILNTLIDANVKSLLTLAATKTGTSVLGVTLLVRDFKPCLFVVVLVSIAFDGPQCVPVSISYFKTMFKHNCPIRYY